MSDGKFVSPILAEGGYLITGWGRGDSMVAGAARHKEAGTDLRFLRYVGNEVVTISQEEQEAILAADQQAAEQAIADAQAAAIAAQQAVEQAAIAAANAPFEVSKFKLCMAFMQSGKLADFMAFIHADPQTAFLWDAASVLDSDNPMVLAALDQLSGLLPDGYTPRDFLSQCRVQGDI